MATYHDAGEAIFQAVADLAEEIKGTDQMYLQQKASALRDLAAAFRHVRGGAQPGGMIDTSAS